MNKKILWAPWVALVIFVTWVAFKVVGALSGNDGYIGRILFVIVGIPGVLIIAPLMFFYMIPSGQATTNKTAINSGTEKYTIHNGRKKAIVVVGILLLLIFFISAWYLLQS